MYLEHIWATSRGKWVTMPQNKIKGCIFCGIAKGDKAIPKKVIHKNKDVMVIMNIFPYNPGHLQVIPIRHVKNLEDLNNGEFVNFFSMAKKSIMLLKKAMKPRGFNIGINIGNFAGASIEHLHMQIVPRYNREVGFMEITSHTKVMPMSLEEVYRKLLKYKDILKD